MTKYDLKDPNDIVQMCSIFDSYSDEDWAKYVDSAKVKNIGHVDISLLLDAQKKARLSKVLNVKQIALMLSIVDKLDEMVVNDLNDDKTK